MTANHTLLGLASTALLAAFSPGAHAIVSSTSLLHGEDVSYLDAVTKLSLNRSDGTHSCSGSLLAGGMYVLTAAHCVSGGKGTATTNSITLSWNGGAVSATSSTYYVATGWDGDLDEGNDLALIALSSAITGIDGYELYDASAQGSTVLIAGYGKTGTGDTGATGTSGTLYYGYNEYDASGRFYQTYNVSDAVYLYDFDDGTRPTSIFGSLGLTSYQESIVASGDSGGASLLYSGGNWYLAGVHSFIACLEEGCSLDSSFGNFAGDVSVYAQRDWLQSYLVAAVPEPSDYAMMLAGLGMIGVVARLRQKGMPGL